jgi:hypothetical protein
MKGPNHIDERRVMEYWKTTITVDVLSRGVRPPLFENLDEVSYAITHGDCSGYIEEVSSGITRKEFVRECDAHSTDLEFFFSEDEIDKIEDEEE